MNTLVEHLSVRVYGLLTYQRKILLVKEHIQGKEIVKFPGGGLELGEGPHACLQRELHEELHVEVTVKGNPMYVPGEFIQSAFLPNCQIVLMYYHVPLTLAQKNQIIPAQEIHEIVWKNKIEAILDLSLSSDLQAISQLNL